MCQTDTYIMSGGAYKYKEKYMVCVHNNSSAQTCKEKSKALAKKKKRKKKAWHMHKRFVMYAMSFSSSLQPLML